MHTTLFHRRIHEASRTRAARFLCVLLVSATLLPAALAVGVQIADAQCPGGNCLPLLAQTPPGGGPVPPPPPDLGTPPGGGGGGGGIFGGIFSALGELLKNPIVLTLLITLLMQLFQGGATPQTGPVEEQPPIPPSGGERFYTGPRDAASPSPVPGGPAGAPSSSPSPDCGCTLTLEYDLVCGADGKTYINTCEAECAGTVAAHTGTCKQ